MCFRNEFLGIFEAPGTPEMRQVLRGFGVFFRGEPKLAQKTPGALALRQVLRGTRLRVRGDQKLA